MVTGKYTASQGAYVVQIRQECSWLFELYYIVDCHMASRRALKGCTVHSFPFSVSLCFSVLDYIQIVVRPINRLLQAYNVPNTLR